MNSYWRRWIVRSEITHLRHATSLAAIRRCCLKSWFNLFSMLFFGRARTWYSRPVQFWASTATRRTKQDAVWRGRRLDETFTPSDWFCPIRSIMWKHKVFHKNGSTKRVALLPEEDRAAATGNMCRKYGGIWSCGFWDTSADRQTDKPAHGNTSYLYGAEIRGYSVRRIHPTPDWNRHGVVTGEQYVYVYKWSGYRYWSLCYGQYSRRRTQWLALGEAQQSWEW